ncbi:MAG: patatin-like phospholipase family protein [Candidatus Thiodiazotropha sp.]
MPILRQLEMHPMMNAERITVSPFASLFPITCLFALVILVYGVDLAYADDLSADRSNHRPKIGLVLSGGGARGASHIGVLKVLEAHRIPIDIITGTSMGSIVGGMYAYGYSVDEIERLLAETDWDRVFRDEAPRSERSLRRKQDDYNFLIKLEAGIKDGKFIIPKGLLQGQQLSLRLKSLTLSAPDDFDDMPIRFRAVATDIESGEAVALQRGSLSDAMLASMAIPGVFAPVEWHNRLLVDGGVANNLPVQLARDLGADIIIAVDLSSEMQSKKGLGSPFSILNQTLGFTIQKNTDEQRALLTPSDILIQPDLSGYSSTDFWQAGEMIDHGATAANLKNQQLSRLSLTENAYRSYVSNLRQRHDVPVIIDKISFDNQTPLDTDILKAHITLNAGDELDLPGLEDDFNQLFGMNIFKRIDYDLMRGEEDTELMIHAEEKDWGPHYIRFGMIMQTNFEEMGSFNLATSYTLNPINSMGGEWRSEIAIGHDQRLTTELYQPIDDQLRYYFRTALGYYKNHVGIYESGHQIADMEVSYSSLGLAAGRHFGNWGTLELGAYTGSGDTGTFIGDMSAPNRDIKIGAWVARFMYDNLDSINLPRSGSMASVVWTAHRDELGADREFDTYTVEGLNANSWGRNTVMLWAGIAGAANTDEPVTDAFSVGGLFNLSGYHESELSGRYAGIMRMIYLREIGNSRSIFKLPVYLGASLEAGNVWNRREDIRFDSLIYAGTVNLAIDSPLGPVYLAQGFAEGGRTETYLYLGRTFSFF